eukprot:TRINITY_DN7210_c1_g1_i2.p1 TRINITY_DN7210_c1_g1~~TRINITY_DN7210_c1_g1_i2.p1  ORF type:complete len:395 (-),score=38.40 TRINITY_DN7210_c1_g1_i2:353-1537(-)
MQTHVLTQRGYLVLTLLSLKHKTKLISYLFILETMVFSRVSSVQFSNRGKGRHTTISRSLRQKTRRQRGQERPVPQRPNSIYSNTEAEPINGLVVGSVLSAAHVLWSSPAQAVAEAASSGLDSTGALSFAVGGGMVLTALSAALVSADPQKRRNQQALETGGNEKEAVKTYFNTTGFDRWKKIYGDTDDVNKVQLDIRQGHDQTVGKVLKWIDEEGSLQGTTVCDAGCGTGSLSIPMAMRGAQVTASDISDAMVKETQQRFEEAKAKSQNGSSIPQMKYEVSDLASLQGKYSTVTCLDVMIHYQQDEVDKMIQHLASLAEQRLILSFAPKTLQYSFLKRIGELFPGPSKATRAYLHSENEIENALNKAGWKVVKKEMTATSFYYSRLFQAVPSS